MFEWFACPTQVESSMLETLHHRNVRDMVVDQLKQFLRTGGRGSGAFQATETGLATSFRGRRISGMHEATTTCALRGMMESRMVIEVNAGLLVVRGIPGDEAIQGKRQEVVDRSQAARNSQAARKRQGWMERDIPFHRRAMNALVKVRAEVAKCELQDPLGCCKHRNEVTL